jgi:hypothetical protein
MSAPWRTNVLAETYRLARSTLLSSCRAYRALFLHSPNQQSHCRPGFESLQLNVDLPFLLHRAWKWMYGNTFILPQLFFVIRNFFSILMPLPQLLGLFENPEILVAHVDLPQLFFFRVLLPQLFLFQVSQSWPIISGPLP